MHEGFRAAAAAAVVAAGCVGCIRVVFVEVQCFPANTMCSLVALLQSSTGVLAAGVQGTFFVWKGTGNIAVWPWCMRAPACYCILNTTGTTAAGQAGLVRFVLLIVAPGSGICG